MDSEYELSDSEIDYSKQDKLLLQHAKDLMNKREFSSDEEIFGFEESDSDEEKNIKFEENNENSDIESDSSHEEKLPYDRAWGKNKKNFYNTDFIDQDYEGIYSGKEAEIAELEEEEAKNIQKRLVEQLNEADFSVIEALATAQLTDTIEKEELIRPDVTKLTKRQKLDLLRKESPEFFIIIEDFKQNLKEAQKFFHVIEYFKHKVKKSFLALQFLQVKLTIILNYCTNISFYLFLKAKKIPVKSHPVLKSLLKYRQLLKEMEEIDVKIIQPQLSRISKIIKSGKDFVLDENLIDKKIFLKLLPKKLQEQQRPKKFTSNKCAEEVESEKVNPNEMKKKLDEIIANERQVPLGKDEKRAITYEMAKNKGLTPKRSKEQRNPRVKHRRKYEKAKIRRRGQVRNPRNEIPVYGGEPTGIKLGLTKSIKLK